MTSKSAYEPGVRSKAKRNYERAAYDHETVHAVIDAGSMCHVGYAIDGQPYVTPTIHWRQGTRLFWHGSSASRMLRTVRAAVPACLTVSHFDGFVLARSAFHHSVNYRSVLAFGKAKEVVEPAAKMAALEAMMQRFFQGRWETLRPVTDQELKATMVVEMEIEEASAKIRTGPPIDDEPDYDWPVWAGVLPVQLTTGAPEPDPRLKPGVSVPDHVTEFVPGKTLD